MKTNTSAISLVRGVPGWVQSLINTAASARCGDPPWNRDLFQQFATQLGKSLKRLMDRQVPPPRAEAEVLMSGLSGTVVVWGIALVLILTGCKSIGPGQVAGDRFDYSAAIGESWKAQTLLNIVKLRYLDPPIFVDLGQIVASRSLVRTFSANGSASGVSGGYPIGTVFGSAGVSAGGTYSDQPTVTFTPLTGDKFIKSLMMPLKPEAVVFVIQSGWPADHVLMATASSINDLKNQQTTVTGTTLPQHDFLRALELMRKIQLAGGVALRVEEDKEKHTTPLFSIRRHDLPPETLADSRELRRLLRLDPDTTDFSLVFGATAANDKEIAMQTRSIIQLMQTLAAQVDVPAKDLAEHRVPPGWESVPGAEKAPRMIDIQCSKDHPADAFVAVQYRGYWSYIDDRDLKSKRTFSFMRGLFTLADTSEKPPLPQVVVPAR